MIVFIVSPFGVRRRAAQNRPLSCASSAGRRADFADLKIRTLQCSASVNLAISSFKASARDAQRAVDADPLRESNWWLLMDAHAGTGDLASAITAYERCRSTLARELGITPSPATRERHAAILARTSRDQ